MKQIQRKLGDGGFAAAIRLIEVLTYRTGTLKNFNPVLTLCPPTNELWLAREILTYEDNFDESYSPTNHLTDFLNQFTLAGLITMQTVAGKRNVETTDGWELLPCKFTTIQLVEFEEFMDVWTARKVKDRNAAGKD
jgi:hypothetical protein